MIITIASSTLALLLALSSPEMPNAKQDIYLAKLADCESSGQDDKKIVDSNGYYSYGAFMFQKSTFLEQNEKYKLGYSESDIMDYQKQKYLTHIMLQDGNEWRWKYCTKKLGKYPK